jgi:hypothetical protein
MPLINRVRSLPVTVVIACFAWPKWQRLNTLTWRAAGTLASFRQAD